MSAAIQQAFEQALAASFMTVAKRRGLVALATAQHEFIEEKVEVVAVPLSVWTKLALAIQASS